MFRQRFSHQILELNKMDFCLFFFFFFKECENDAFMD